MIRKLDAFNRISFTNSIMNEVGIRIGSQVEIHMEYGQIHISVFNGDDWESKPYVGIIRSVYVMNRITIPGEFVRLLNMKYGDAFDMRIEKGGEIILKKI